MKTLILLSFIVVCIANGYSQNTPSEINYENTESDSVLISIHSFALDYSKEMETWSPERKAWFTKTFAYTRGNFTIPKEPIQPWKE
jgi:hypothetical protein